LSKMFVFSSPFSWHHDIHESDTQKNVICP
jgi:hypothetical protein